MNILIVDDLEENRYLLAALLKGKGHDVEAAANGAEALERLKSGNFELIISDILMPVMDGFQLCRKVKADEALRHIPFIVYTATYTGPQDEAFALKIGADRFIQKPCERDVFMETIRDVMATAKGRDIASMPAPVHDEEMLKLYNERLVRKLEQKMLQLEREVQTRREVEETLRASERKYRLLADSTLDVIWAMDLDLAFTYVNPAVQSLMGYSPEEWIGSRLPEHCDEENFAKMAQVIADETAKGLYGSGVVLEAVLLKKNREPIPIEIHGKVIYDEHGAPILLQGTARDISERKRGEETLRENEKKYRELYDFLPIPVYEMDFEANITSANRAIYKTFRGTEEDFKRGFKGWQLLSPEEVEKSAMNIQRLLKGEQIAGTEYTLKRLDGSVFPAIVISSVIYSDGKPVGLRGAIVDITERKRAEEELRKSEEETKRLARENAIVAEIGRIISSTLELDEVYALFAKEVQKLIPFDRIGINTVDVEKGMGVLAYVAGQGIPDRGVGVPYALEVTGMAEMIHTGSIVLVQTDDINEMKTRFPRLLSTFEAGFRSIMDVPLFAKGQIIGALLLRSVHSDAYNIEHLQLAERVGRQIAGAIANAKFYFERKQAEEALKESEKRFRTLFEYAPDAFFLHDLKGTFIDGNRAAEAMIGYNKKELIGKSFLELGLLSSDSFQQAARSLQDSAQDLAAGSDTLVLNRKDGRQVFAEIRSLPLTIRGQDIVLGIARDISERKSLQEQLFQSQKLEAIARLTASIAHDFNNLLTTILGNAEMALMDLGKEEPLYEVMVEINEAGKRAASLTRQLLAFSRKQILQPEILNLNGVVRDMDKMLRRLIGEDIEPKTILSPDLGRVEADVGQIEQVLMNLALNAKDAMPRGGKLTIETANVDLDEEYAKNHVAVTPGPYVMLCASDTGVGMSPEVKAHLFEPFFTTKDKGKGTGLGLSTVHGIVKQSKGNIWVYSEPGRGTTFKIYLPRVEKTGHVVEKAEIGEKGLTGSETILVVEDDEILRGMALRALERYGYAVHTAADGQKALRIFREHEGPIDLILTDMMMPGMSGKALAEQLKGLRPALKVLYMSGYTEETIVHYGVLDAGIAFIQKPFTAEGLARKVREALDR